MANVGDLFINVGLAGFNKVIADLNTINQKVKEVPPVKIATPEIAKPVNDELAKIPKVIPIKAQVETPKTFSQGLTAGISRISEATKGFREGLGKAFAGLESLGNKAAATFGVMTAGIIGLVRAASPGHFQLFTDSLTVLAKELGFILIPILKTVTLGIIRLAEWIRNLSESTKGNILAFAKISLVLLGIVAVVPRILSALKLIPLAFSGVLAAVNLLLVSNPAGWFIGLVSAIAAGIAALAALGGFFLVAGQKGDSLGEKLNNLWKSFQGLMTKLQPSLNAMMNLFRTVFAAIESYVAVVGDIFKEFGLSWDKVIDTAQAVFLVFISHVSIGVRAIATGLIALSVIVKRFAIAFSEVFHALYGAVKPILSAIADLFIGAWNNIATAFGTVKTWIITGIETLMKAFLGLGEAATRIFSALIKSAQAASMALLNPAQAAVMAAGAQAELHDAMQPKRIKEFGENRLKQFGDFWQDLKKDVPGIKKQELPDVEKPLLNKLVDLLLPSNIADEIRERVKKFNELFDEKMKNDKGEKGLKKAPDFLQRREPPQLIGIGDAWRKFMSSQQDPTLEQMKKQQNLLTMIDEKLKQIAGNTAKQPNYGAMI